MKIRGFSAPAALALAGLFAFGGPALAQQNQTSRLGGRYFAAAYTLTGGAINQVYGGPYAAGTLAIQLARPYLLLADGRSAYVYANATITNLPLTIGIGANAETVTPTAASGCAANVSVGNCTITVVTANAHGSGDPVYSGSGGVSEAAIDANTSPGGSGGVVVVDPSFSGTAANITTARSLFANVSIEDVRQPLLPPQTLVAVGTGTATASSTLYLVGPGAATNAFTNTTATNATFVAPRSGTLTQMLCTATTGGVGAGSGVVRVRTAPVSSGTFANSAITATFGTGTSANDVQHTASVVAGQPIQIQVTSAASETLAGAVCTLQLN
jgi:hypothetical protein